MEKQEISYEADSDVDVSFTPTATSIRTLSSFNEFLLSTNSDAVHSPNLRPHRRHKNPNWAAINAVTGVSSDGEIHIRDLKLIRSVGKGNLGRVFLCRLREHDDVDFAVKVIDRSCLSSKKLSHVETESKILSGLDHPFLPTLYAHLEASNYTCLLMDYCCNGDLHFLLRKQPRNRLSVTAARFYAAEVLLALEYLHAQGIVYRDLKPENVLIGEDGHVMLSDFDLCFQSEVSPRLETEKKKIMGPPARFRFGFSCTRLPDPEEERVTEFVSEPVTAFSKSCVGTHEYLAPELLGWSGHGNGVDWWAFGVLIYEMIYGVTPFKGRTKESTLRTIASANGVSFPAAEHGETAAAVDLIEKLLVKDPLQRLGCSKGATDIKSHPFFRGVKWPLIRTYRPPEIPGLDVKAAGDSSPRSGRYFWRKPTHHRNKITGSKSASGFEL